MTVPHSSWSIGDAEGEQSDKDTELTRPGSNNAALCIQTHVCCISCGAVRCMCTQLTSESNEKFEIEAVTILI